MTPRVWHWSAACLFIAAGITAICAGAYAAAVFFGLGAAVAAAHAKWARVDPDF